MPKPNGDENRDIEALRHIGCNPELRKQLSSLMLGLREQMGLDKEDMAELLNVSKAYLTRYEGGTGVPSLAVFRRAKLIRRVLNHVITKETQCPDPTTR